jgi:uncharacterized membrane protein
VDKRSKTGGRYMLLLLKWFGSIIAIWFVFWPLADWLLGLKGINEERKRLNLSFAFSLPIGLAVLSYIAWIGMMLKLRMFRPFVLWAILILIALLLWGTWGRKRFFILIENRLTFATLLALSIALTAFWGIVRVAGNEEVIKIGEHVMNISFAQVVIRYPQIPPPNPFFAGFKVDFYYYFFAIIIAILATLSGLPVHVAYFTAGITWPAIAGLEIYALLSLWAKRSFTPLTGIMLYIFTGNWGIFRQFAAESSNGHINFPPISELWWFQSTRLIPDPNPYGFAITEFPIFSFAIGDLHPHVVVIPWAVLGLFIAITGELKGWKEVTLSSFLIGIIAPLNSWTLIPVLVLLCLRLVFNYRPLEASTTFFFVILGAFILFLPFHLQLKSPIIAYKFGLFPTQWWSWALHWAPFLFPAFLGVAFMTQNRWLFLTTFALGIAIGCLVKAQILVILIASLLVIFWIAKQEGLKPWMAFILGWILVNLIPEIFYLEDYWGGRYNTIFKLYFEGWLLISLAIPLMLENLPKWAKSISKLWMGTGIVYTVAFLVFIAPNFPILANGINFYWLQPNYFAPDRLSLLRSLSQYPNVSYILEAKTEYPIGPVLTGLIELAQHDFVLPLWYPQRASIVGRNLVARDWFFKTDDATERARILRTYPIDAVIIGHEERWLYGYDLDFRLSPLLTPALSSGYVIAYRNFTPEVCLELKGPIVFKGEKGEMKLEALRITKGLDFDNKPVLAIFEIWETIRGDPAEMSFYVHFLDSSGNIIAQGDHPLGLWGTRWTNYSTNSNRKPIYSVHWISLSPSTSIFYVRIGLWSPKTGQYIPAVEFIQGKNGPNGSLEFEFKH